MSRGIEYSKPPDTIREDQLSIFNSNTFQPLHRVHIRNTSQLPSFHMIVLRILLVSCQLLLINLVEFLENVSCKCGLSRVYMTDENQVGILLPEYLNVGVLVLRPFVGQELI